MASFSEDSCIICFNNYNSSDRQVVSLPCSHSLCVTCFIQLKSSNSHTCPLCRDDLAHLELMVIKPEVKSEIMGANNDVQESDLKSQLMTETGVQCVDHAMPLLFWCSDCMEFSCKKCVIKKQKTCTFEIIEDVLPNIKAYFNKRIEQITVEIFHNNTDSLNTALMQATEMFATVTTLIEDLPKHQQELAAYVKLLESMIFNRRQNLTAVKNKCSVGPKEGTEISVILECMKNIDMLQKLDIPPMPSISNTFYHVMAHTYMAEAQRVNGSATDITTAQGAVLLEEGEEWTVDASNWRAAVLALTERQPRCLTLRAARNGVPEDLPAEAVATIAKAVQGSEVCIRFLDTFYSPQDLDTDRKRLKNLLKNTSLDITRYFGHLDTAGIARLPGSVVSLGLAIGSAGDAAAVSSMDLWGQLSYLSVAVSVKVSPRDLRPLPRGCCLCLHFYGVTDAQVGSIRPALIALVPNMRIAWFYLPKCQLSACGARRLAHQLTGVTVESVAIDPSGLWRPLLEEQERISEVFRVSVKCRVEWDMKWLFG